MSKKNKIEVKLMDGNTLAKPNQIDMDSHKAILKEAEQEVKGNCKIVSRLDHPVVIPYGNYELRISPRATLRVDSSLLPDKLPTGITKI